MTSTTFPIRRNLRSLALSAGLAILVAACSAAGAVSTPGASDRPDRPEPSQPAIDPTPVPTNPPANPTPAPSEPAVEDPGDDLTPIHVDLTTTTNADVTVDIVDRTGRLAGARTGSPAEGVSVDTGVLEVHQVDATTLRLKWSDFPIDNRLALFFDPAGQGYLLTLVQPPPTGPADAIGVDRELLLEFNEPISVDLIRAQLQDGLDTPG
jgi:hypothetical protein